jgi:hypothetical protein
MTGHLATAALVVSVVVAAAFYLAVRRNRGLSFAKVFPLWLVAFVFEFVFLGPFSYVGMESEGNLAVAMDYFLAHGYDGGRFMHRVGGGQDAYVWFLGMQYVQPEKWFFALFPTWIAIALAKLMVGALGFVGTYLLAKRVAPESERVALALACVFPVAHTYLTDFSTSFGTGFAAIPLAVYWCVGCTQRPGYWWRVAASAAILACADPVKVFPTLALSFVAGAILIDQVRPVRAILALLACIALSILNWHEVIYGLATMAPEIARGLGLNVEHSASIPAAANATVYFLRDVWLPVGLIAMSLVLLARHADGYIVRAVAACVTVFVAIVGALAFPWDKIGLPIAARLSHLYMILTFAVIATPIAARAFARVRAPQPALLVLAAAVGMLTWDKAIDLARLFALGGQAVYHRIDALAHPDWSPQPGWRTVTLYDLPHPNITAAYYGFEAFDGQLNLNPTAYAEHWIAVLHGNQSHGLGTRPGWYWEYWDGRSYDIERHMRLDLLAAANVRYIFSPLPLKSESLRLLHAAPRETWARVRPDFFDGLGAYVRHRLRLIFEAGDVFVYELPSALPRAFAEPPAVVRETRAVRDGYDVAVEAPEGGVLVINQMPLPFWRAQDQDGHDLPLTAINRIHMQVRVQPGTSLVRFRYARPLLREVLFSAAAARIP